VFPWEKPFWKHKTCLEMGFPRKTPPSASSGREPSTNNMTMSRTKTHPLLALGSVSLGETYF